MKVKIDEIELIKLQVYRDEYRKVMEYLDKKYPRIYNEICYEIIGEIKNELNELKEKT